MLCLKKVLKEMRTALRKFVRPHQSKKCSSGDERPGATRHIVITSLSYPDKYRLTDHTSASLTGTKFDFNLVLKHYDYKHQNNTSHFTLIHDFDLDYTDSTGEQRIIQRTETTRDAILSGIERVVEIAKPGDSIIFYCAFIRDIGLLQTTHSIEQLEVMVEKPRRPLKVILRGRSASFKLLKRGMADQSTQRNCAPDSQQGSQVQSRQAIFDACYTGGSFELPYDYKATGKKVTVNEASKERPDVNMVQISATQPNQNAFSNRYADGYHGQLTHTLFRYLNRAEKPTIDGLVNYLATRCDPTGEQVPQVSGTYENTKVPLNL
ncbi:hypothetical protein FRB90_001985 [Tulasnella sp. 427]|nr:hypothetical protein FRB90_001985 [Tulasnella sp. 427]